jgi:putative toxin-antitoxin system antitoxin component (TIGR02293 family)
MSEKKLKQFLRDEAVPYTVENEMDLIELTRSGIPKKTLKSLAEYSTISFKSLAELLPVSERTIQRYADDEKFKSDVSEHIILIARVLFRADEVFSSREDLKEWLTTPVLSLGERTPLSLLDTSFGAQLVIDELGRLEHGVHS